MTFKKRNPIKFNFDVGKKTKRNIQTTKFFTTGLLMFLVVSSTITANAIADDSIINNNKNTLEETKYRLDLISRSFVPPTGIHLNALMELSTDDSDQSNKEIYFLMQFQDIPDHETKKRLSSQGINILDYIGGNTYIVSSNNDSLGTPSLMENGMSDNVRSVFTLDADDKISPEIKSENIGILAFVPTHVREEMAFEWASVFLRPTLPSLSSSSSPSSLSP